MVGAQIHIQLLPIITLKILFISLREINLGFMYPVLQNVPQVFYGVEIWNVAWPDQDLNLLVLQKFLDNL